MTSIVSLVGPLYVFFFLIAALLYMLAAFVLGVVGALLTLPMLYYSGYGLVPPKLAPAIGNTSLFSAALGQLALGGMFGAASIVVTFFAGPTIPFLLRYQFARVSPRLETIPGFAVGTVVVLAIWLGYLVYVRRRFAPANDDDWPDGLKASIRATIVFGICFLAGAVLSTFTLYL